MMDAISETDRGKALLGPLSCCPMANHSWQQDVFQCGKFRQQKVTLKNKTHFFIPQTRLCGGAATIQSPAFEFDGSRFGTLQTGQGVKKGRFTRAGSARKKHCFITLDFHGDAAQDFDPARAHSKRLINITSYQLRWLHGNYLSLGSTSHNNHRNW